MDVEHRLPVKHVSHTAWLVAALRAQETARPDAHFKDALASKFLETHNETYLERFVESAKKDYWLMTIRTCAIDQCIQDAVQNGVTTIINIGAGLDTRPYRLSLPASLKWYEIDLPDLIAYKHETLKDETANCQLQRLPIDVSEPALRNKILKTIDGISTSTLILTEGLLNYLSEQNVVDLAKELASMNSCRYWLMDIFNPSFFRKNLQPKYQDFQQDDIRLEFIPNDMRVFLQPFGWTVEQFHSFKNGALALNRFPSQYDKDAFESEDDLRESGVCLFSKMSGQII